jgi:hypothetical protein
MRVAHQARLDGRLGGIFCRLPSKFRVARPMRVSLTSSDWSGKKFLSSQGCPFLCSSGAFVVESTTRGSRLNPKHLGPEMET